MVSELHWWSVTTDKLVNEAMYHIDRWLHNDICYLPTCLTPHKPLWIDNLSIYIIIISTRWHDWELNLVFICSLMDDYYPATTFWCPAVPVVFAEFFCIAQEALLMLPERSVAIQQWQLHMEKTVNDVSHC